MSMLSRRNDSAMFETKVALVVIEGEQTVVQLAEHFDVHPNEVRHWKAQLLERAGAVFASERSVAVVAINAEELHAIRATDAEGRTICRRARADTRTERLVHPVRSVLSLSKPPVMSLRSNYQALA